ncbi:MAG: hypothetical protein NVS3B12_14190 [Acidimicrobiales bacterium]
MILAAPLVAIAVTFAMVGGAGAAQPPVGLGTAGSFAVLAGTTVTNTGPSTINGDLGVSPGTAVTGFPPGAVSNGTIHAGDAVAAQAQADTTTAYNDAAGRTPTATVTADLGGQTLTPGVYRGGALSVTGTLTLDAGGDTSAVFVFQAASTLVTASASRVSVINGADPCNVFWQVTSSATLGTNSTFVGTVIALTSITANTGASVAGRLLARNGATTLDTNSVTRPLCAAGVSTTSTTTAGGTSTTLGATTTTTEGPTTTTAAGPTTTIAAGVNVTLATTTTTVALNATGGPAAGGAGGGTTTSIRPGGVVTPTTPTTRTATSLPFTGGRVLPAVLAAVLAILAGLLMLSRSKSPAGLHFRRPAR